MTMFVSPFIQKNGDFRSIDSELVPNDATNNASCKVDRSKSDVLGRFLRLGSYFFTPFFPFLIRTFFFLYSFVTPNFGF
ncbi:hypothetical protein RJT34_07196 [Clitoria ternatea]|uniref:Uncharacterized protein n=1 Tax=Clitoria ternatea TaxID=43366 RepID=A0AAN9PUQ7_CLITE